MKKTKLARKPAKTVAKKAGLKKAGLKKLVIGAYTHVSAAYVDEHGNTLIAQRAFTDLAASSTAPLVTGVAGYMVRVLAAVFMTGDTATSIVFQSGSTAISPDFTAGANGGASLPELRFGWLQTNAGEDLVVTSGTGSTTAVHIIYVLVPI